MASFFGKSWSIEDIYSTTQEREFKSGGCTVIYTLQE